MLKLHYCTEGIVPLIILFAMKQNNTKIKVVLITEVLLG